MLLRKATSSINCRKTSIRIKKQAFGDCTGEENLDRVRPQLLGNLVKTMGCFGYKLNKFAMSWIITFRANLWLERPMIQNIFD